MIRKVLFSLIALFALVGMTKAGSDLPFTDGFEGDLNWTLVNCDASTGKSSWASYTGNYSFRFNFNKNPPQYLISPELTTTSAQKTVSFWYKNHQGTFNSFVETFQVGYSITTSDPSAFQWSNEITASNHQWTPYEDNFPANTKYIAIKYNSNDQYGLFIDDFSVVEYNNYLKPANLTMGTIADKSATVSWTVPASGVTGYAYQYRKVGDEAWSTETAVTTTSATLSGLTPNTAYNFRVKAKYGSDESTFAYIDFTTDCEVVSLPFAEGFENGMGSWTIVDGAAFTGIQEAAAHSGSQGFDFIFNTSATQYLIAPEISGGSAMFVSFWYRTGYANYSETFQVGYSTTTNAPSSFTWGGAITTSDTQWKQYEGSFPAGTKYIAIKLDQTNQSHLYLDDFSFVASSDYFRPTYLTMGTVTPNSTAVSWTPPSGSVTAYVYQYKKASEGTWSDEATVSSASITISGLTESTDYTFRVKARYSGGDSEFATLDFTTSASIPFMEGFENGLGHWTLVNGLVTNYYATGIDSDSKYEGDYAFEFYSSSNETPTQYLISPMLDGGEDMLVSFWYRNGRFDKSARFQVGYSKTTTDTSAFIWGEEIAGEYSSWWTLYEGNFPAETKYVSIKYNNSADNCYLFIDNFCVENANYPKPTSLATSGISPNSATVSWTAPSGEVTGYVYQYKKASEETWSDEVPVTATSVPFSGLQDNTGYDFRVKAIYDDGASMWVTTHFTTLRDVVYLPYIEGFENGLNGWTMVDCKTDSDTPTGIASQAKHNGDNGFRFTYTTAPPQYLISPELDDASAIKVKFWYRAASSSETFHVGYSATTPDLDAFTWGDELTISGRFWTQYEKGFPKGTKYIAIKATSYVEWGLYIDDISIEATAYLEAVQPAHTLTAVSWTGESDSYKVRYRTSVKRGNLLRSNDFENDLDSWTTANLKSGTGVKPGVGVNGGYGFLFSNPSVGATAYQYLISPALSGISDAVELNFYYRNADASKRGSFRVGYSTTTNATDAFSGKETLDVLATKDTDWHLYQLILPADVKYITIESNGSLGSLKNIYIDNISIYNRSAGQWTTITTTDQSAVITGLTPGTEYDIQVIGVKNGVEDTGTAITTFTTLTADEPLELADGANNTPLIEAENGATCDVVLSGRTLYKDGAWNTLCLPFDVTTTSAPLSGDNVVAMVFNNETSSFNDGTLTLNFTTATSIPAGTPFIIKWDANGDLSSPEFSAVTVDKTVRDAVCDLGNGRSITFCGTYKNISYDDVDKSILFLGAENTLYYPESGANISAQRAYFKLDGIEAGEVALARLLFDEDETTEVKEVNGVNGVKDDSWYTLSGMKLEGSPTAPGIYICGGRKVVIK